MGRDWEGRKKRRKKRGEASHSCFRPVKETFVGHLRRHPITAFYRHLWQHNRWLLAKTIGVTYLLPFITEVLPYYAMPLRWASQTDVGKHYTSLNWQLYSNLQASADFSPSLAGEYALYTKDEECEYVCERLILERLLYSELEYNVRTFAEAGLTQALVKEIKYVISVFHSFPELIAQIVNFGVRMYRNSAEHNLLDMALFQVHPTLYGVFKRVLSYFVQPFKQKKAFPEDVERKEKAYSDIVGGLLDLQSNNSQDVQLSRLDEISETRIRKEFAVPMFVAQTVNFVADTAIVYQISDVYIKHSIMKFRGWTWQEYQRRETITAPLRHSLRTILSSISAASSFQASQVRLNDLFNIPNWKNELEELGFVSLVPFRQLVISNLLFSYDPRLPPALDLSPSDVITFENGKTYAIIGPNQSAKSTLAAIICKFYKPQRASISINGIPYDRVARVLLRNIISFVPQKPYIFSGTIRENIRVGNPNATDAQGLILSSPLRNRSISVQYAAECVDLFDFDPDIDPQKLLDEKKIVSEGRNISGGFARAIALARIFVRPFAQIIILDESTANIDAIKKKETIWPRLRAFKEQHGMALIHITHEMEYVRSVDRILLLNAGKLAAQGTHDELLLSSEIYRRMTAPDDIDDLSISL